MASRRTDPARTNTLILLLAAGMLGATTTGPAMAHDPRPLVIDVSVLALTEQNNRLVAVSWKTPASLPYNKRPSVTLPDCTQTARTPDRITSRAYHAQTSHACLESLNTTQAVISYPGSNPALPSFVTLSGLSGQSSTLLAPGTSTFTVALSSGAAAASGDAAHAQSPSAGAYLPLGISHILGGYDHLLFLVCLMLLSPAIRQLFILLTGFTLSHSLTLALHSLGTIRVSSHLVEPLIALSIAILAAELCRNNKTTLTRQYPFAVTFGFGLLHGLGFAGVLRELGLPAGQQLQALFLFNVGVEVGQIVFVGVLGALYLATRRIALIPAAFHPSGTPTAPTKLVLFGVGSIAAYWFISRVPGLL
ncbi:MAG: HupE/UreJ family protein [Parvibaculales bacterium]